jgi:hypothetical protein
MENLKKVSAPFYFWAPDVARKRRATEDRHSPFAAFSSQEHGQTR